MTPARAKAHENLIRLYDLQEQAIIEAKREIRGRYAPKIEAAKAALKETK